MTKRKTKLKLKQSTRALVSVLSHPVRGEPAKGSPIPACVPHPRRSQRGHARQLWHARECFNLPMSLRPKGCALTSVAAAATTFWHSFFVTITPQGLVVVRLCFIGTKCFFGVLQRFLCACKHSANSKISVGLKNLDRETEGKWRPTNSEIWVARGCGAKAPPPPRAR